MNVRKQSFEITADRLIETWTIFCFFTHAGNISPETPIETQHLVIYFYSRPYLALFKSLAYFLNPVTIALSLDRSLLMCWPSIHVFCNHQGNFIYIIPESYENSISVMFNTPFSHPHGTQRPLYVLPRMGVREILFCPAFFCSKACK